MRLSWLSLYRQFGTDPDKASDNVTVQNFRKDCLRDRTELAFFLPTGPVTFHSRGSPERSS